jgi:hypothetical protein
MKTHRLFPSILLCGLALLGWVSMASAQWVTQTIPLQSGWNAVHLRVQPFPAACDQVLSNLPVTGVHRYNTRNAADRQRAREQTGTEPLPGDLKIPFEQAREDINRAAQFLHDGKITREEYATRCGTLKQRFEHLGRQALKDRGEPSDAAILDRLKQRLDQSAQSAETIVSPPR